MPLALNPRIAHQEIDRIVAKARQHPNDLDHWFKLVPAQSRDILAFWMLELLVAVPEGETQ